MVQKKPCPDCGALVSPQGMKGHQRWAHSQGLPGLESALKSKSASAQPEDSITEAVGAESKAGSLRQDPTISAQEEAPRAQIEVGDAEPEAPTSESEQKEEGEEATRLPDTETPRNRKRGRKREFRCGGCRAVFKASEPPSHCPECGLEFDLEVVEEASEPPAAEKGFRCATCGAEFQAEEPPTHCPGCGLEFDL